MSGRRGVFIGPELREMRKAAGMSQRKFAKAIGVRYRSIEDYEAGRTSVHEAKAAELRRRAGMIVALRAGLSKIGAAKKSSRDSKNH